MNISEIRKQPDQAIIYDFQGIIKRVFAQKPKTGIYPGTTQFIVVENEGDTIGVTLNDHNAVGATDERTPITIKAHSGAKGWTGVYATHYTVKDGKPAVGIRVTKTASVSWGSVVNTGMSHEELQEKVAEPVKEEPKPVQNQQKPTINEPTGDIVRQTSIEKQCILKCVTKLICEHATYSGLNEGSILRYYTILFDHLSSVMNGSIHAPDDATMLNEARAQVDAEEAGEEIPF